MISDLGHNLSLAHCDLQEQLDKSASGTGLAFILFTGNEHGRSTYIKQNLNILGKLSKKKTTKHMENSICRGGVQAGHFPYVITEDLKCIESHFEHF